MFDTFSLIYLQYTDYFLFLFGYLFIGLGTLLFVFSEQGKRLFEGKLIFFILFLWIVAFAIWSDLLLLVFPHAPIFESLHYVLYLAAYLFLFEFGRRMLFQKKCGLFLCYGLSIIFFLLDDSLLLFRNYFAVLGSFFLGIVFVQKKKARKGIAAYLFPASFFFLMLLYLSYMVYHYFASSVYRWDSLHFVKHGIEWLIIVVISLLILRNMLSIEIQDPIEIQLKQVKLKRVGIYGKLFLAVAVIGYGFVHFIGVKAWEHQRQDMLNVVQIAAIGIDGETHQLLKGIPEDETGEIYHQIKKQLEVIQSHLPFVTYSYTMILQDEHLIFAVDPSTVSGVEGDHSGDVYDEATPKMLAIFQQGTAAVEDHITFDRWGNWLSAYAPIKNNEGEMVALLGMDIAAKFILQEIRSARFVGLLVLLVVLIANIGISFLTYMRHREKVWRNYHSKILSSIGDMVVVFDKEQKIYFANHAMYTLTGISMGENGTKRLAGSLFSLKEQQRFARSLQELKTDKVRFAEYILVAKNNKQIPVFTSLTYLTYDPVNPLYVMTVTDISEQKKREADLQRHYSNTLSLLASVVDAKDDYTARHSTNVARYSVAIAKELGYTQEKIKEIETAALLHDIGKIAVPDHILKKEGPLTEEEWSLMKRHTEFGKQILERIEGTFHHFIPYVYYHHERYDGKGYPTQMKKPPKSISIISVADAFDAMTSNRSYRKRLSLEQAKNELLRHSGSQFHPEIVQAFLAVLEREDFNI